MGSLSLGAAVKSGDESAVYSCLLRGDNPDAPCWDVDSPHPPILLAALGSNPNILRLLCEAGCDVNARNMCGETSLHIVIAKRTNIYDCIDVLLDYQADCAIQEKMRGSLALHWLARHCASCDDSMTAIRTLHRLSCHTPKDPTPCDYRGRTPLHYAVTNPAPLLTVLHMIADWSGFDYQDKRGNSALHDCLEGEHSSHCSFFLMSKTNLALSNLYGETPLHIAARKGNETEVSELLRLGADPNAVDVKGDTPLHAVAGRGYAKIAEVLISSSVTNVNIANVDGLTPLHIAVDSNFLLVIQVLLKTEQCDLKVLNKRYETALDMAEEGNKRKSHPKISLAIRQEIERRDFELSAICIAKK